MSDNFYIEESGGDSQNLMGGKSPRTLYNDYAKAQQSGPKAQDLPKLSLDDPNYSSTMVMLKRTRLEVEEFGKDLGAVNAVVELPVSSDVRRTVAKMFADPRNAEAISESEWRRREHQYQLEREQFGDRINEQLKRERSVMDHELQQLSKLN